MFECKLSSPIHQPTLNPLADPAPLQKAPASSRRSTIRFVHLGRCVPVRSHAHCFRGQEQRFHSGQGEGKATADDGSHVDEGQGPDLGAFTAQARTRTVLTMEDLSAALKEYGVGADRAPYYL